MAAHGKVEISVDTSQVDKSLDRLLTRFAPELFLKWEARLARAFLECEAKIHVETGSLKSTARPESEGDGFQWHGQVKVGGAAPGQIRDPAYYGVYELARGGRHFFLEPAYDIMGADNIVQDIIDGFKGHH